MKINPQVMINTFKQTSPMFVHPDSANDIAKAGKGLLSALKGISNSVSSGFSLLRNKMASSTKPENATAEKTQSLFSNLKEKATSSEKSAQLPSGKKSSGKTLSPCEIRMASIKELCSKPEQIKSQFENLHSKIASLDTTGSTAFKERRFITTNLQYIKDYGSYENSKKALEILTSEIGNTRFSQLGTQQGTEQDHKDFMAKCRESLPWIKFSIETIQTGK